MKKSTALFLTSFIISLALIGGIWSFLKIDYAAKRIGFHNANTTSISEQPDTTFSGAFSLALDFAAKYPQVLPYPVRIGAWAASVLPEYVTSIWASPPTI